jgi:nicotinamidase-related amidase
MSPHAGGPALVVVDVQRGFEDPSGESATVVDTRAALAG